jgi:syntaxin 16
VCLSSFLMTTRSRTNLFLSYRDSRARTTSRFSRSRAADILDEADDDDEHARLIVGDHVTVDVPDLPPKW